MYKVVRCLKCSTFQLSTANKVFKCVKCNKSRQINRMKIFYENISPQLSNKVLQEIKKEDFKLKNESIDDDFKSAG